MHLKYSSVVKSNFKKKLLYYIEIRNKNSNGFLFAIFNKSDTN
jgi:hypothetical protein